MEPNSPRKIQFTVPLLEPHLDPEAAEQIRRRRPTPATLVLSGDQSSPEIDEERIPNHLQKSTLSPHQRKKVTRTTPTMKELQLLAEHHLCKQGSEDEGTLQRQDSLDDRPSLGFCCHGNTAPIQASQQPNSCSCFMQDGQQETNSLERRKDSQTDSSEGLTGIKK
ncbi:protein phosphatase 1 regulatory subunit 1A isoform X2 [Bombina bombina]|uniref:protein phosphatase 1 regulatory subunit 1A isoform X2 n=1 Tax=Bombina bombina TaxID=8345 RepID=UPI00235B1496|nr:protein phosphatase 1 regulatory subunit 1A isoform X2 [Bombina bombina]